MAEDGTGAPAPAPGILQGAKLVEVPVGGRSDPNRFYAIYEFPVGSGKYIAYQFDSKDQMLATFGVKEIGYSSRNLNVRNETWFNQHVLATGAAEEVIGQKGHWIDTANSIMREAAAAAGARDPSLAGKMAKNKEMQNIMVQAIVGEWTPEQILAEQRKTNFWKNELYPGIQNLYGRTDNPEKMYSEYIAQVTPSLQALGYKADADGSFKKHIKRMLDKGIDSNVFLSQVPTFIRATQNAEFAGVLNQWAERDLGRNINFNDWFGLMAGETQPELEQVAERATLQWVAENQGSSVTRKQVEDLAARTQLSEAEARQAFSEFNQSVLALGDQGLSKYGLSRDEVLSAAAGVSSASGRSVDEVKLLVAKTAREQALFDDEKINFYVGYNPQGTPTRPGLQSLSPEGA